MRHGRLSVIGKPQVSEAILPVSLHCSVLMEFGAVQERVGPEAEAAEIVIVDARQGILPGLLGWLGREHITNPRAGRILVFDEAPPLPVVVYLASCGASLLISDGAGVETIQHRIEDELSRLEAARPWTASAPLSPSNGKENHHARA